MGPSGAVRPTVEEMKGRAHRLAMDDVVHRVWIVFGRVQGVGYRAHVHHLASRFQVSGSVANLEDGTVRVEAQGSPLAVEEFLAAVLVPRGRIQPQGVRRAEELHPEGGLTGFVVAPRDGTGP